MNKTILIAGGASIASLAAGGAAGYFIAKKQFDKTLDHQITEEVEKTRAHFFATISKLEEKVWDLEHTTYDAEPPTPTDEVDDSSEVEELSEEDQKTVDKARDDMVDQRAKRALIDYQGISTRKIVSEEAKPALASLVENNIFDADKIKEKKVLPPRGEGGRFRPKHAESASRPPENEPYIITAETFLENEPEYAQESALYYVNDNTVVLATDYSEAIDNAIIGEVNLTLFPEGEPSVIYVRHEKLEIDYQVTRTKDSLTEAMGLGESESDLEGHDEDNEYANQD